MTAVDPPSTPTTLTLTLNSARAPCGSRLGTSLSVVVTPTTRVVLKSGATMTPITLSQVVVGEKAWVHGTIDRSQATPVFTATQITVQAANVPTPRSLAGRLITSAQARERGRRSSGRRPLARFCSQTSLRVLGSGAAGTFL